VFRLTRSWVREADVLLVSGGDALYLCHWMQQSGLAALLPSLPETAIRVTDGTVNVVSEGHWTLLS
jgi:hypothetical protein